MADQAKHVSRDTWDQVSKRLASINPPLQQSLERLLQHDLKATTQLPLYLATYAFGEQLFGPLSGSSESRLITPCTLCSRCRDLHQACGNDPVLGIILKNTAEIYVQADPPDIESVRTSRGERKKILRPARNVPLRILSPGEVFGVFEVLDLLEGRRVSTSASWRISSGARNTFITTPFGDKSLAEAIASLATDRARSTYLAKHGHLAIGESDYKYLFDEDNWTVIKLIADRLAADSGSSWQTDVLILPLNWLRPRIYDEHGNVRPHAEMFLLTLYRVYLDQSRHFRETLIEDAILDDALQGFSIYTRHTLQQLLLIARNDLPGLIPYRSDLSFGPLADVQQFLLAKFGKHLTNCPLILHPVQISSNRDASGVAHAMYSVTKPTILHRVTEKALKPADRFKEIRQAAERIRDEAPELAEHVSIKCFASGVLRGADNTYRDGKGRTDNLYLVTSDSKELREGLFKDQLELIANQQVGKMNDPLGYSKSEFLHQWIQISSSKRTQSELQPASVAAYRAVASKR